VSDTGPDLIRAAIERDRGMGPPSQEETRSLTGCCTPPEGPEGFAPQPPPLLRTEPLKTRLADALVNALFCPACIRFRFGPGHLLFCDGGRSGVAVRVVSKEQEGGYESG
jgi:hypothetical protein